MVNTVMELIYHAKKAALALWPDDGPEFPRGDLYPDTIVTPPCRPVLPPTQARVLLDVQVKTRQASMNQMSCALRSRIFQHAS